MSQRCIQDQTRRRIFWSSGGHFSNNDLNSDHRGRSTLQLFSKIRRSAVLLTVSLVVLDVGWTPDAQAEDSLENAFEKDVLVIAASSHACYRFDVYLAVAVEQQQRGLMFVRKLAAMSGMLFVYENAYHAMWMKNTFIPLDMVFAREDGSVSSVVHNTVPQSLVSIRSIEPVSFVLELNGGTAERFDIDEDSYLIWEPTK